MCLQSSREQDNLLIWFLATLKGEAVDWFWSHSARALRTWIELKTVFLRKYTMEINQRGVIMVLARSQEGINEPLAKYVRRDKAVAAMGANCGLLESIV